MEILWIGMSLLLSAFIRLQFFESHMGQSPSQLPCELVLDECRAMVWSFDRNQWVIVGEPDVYQIQLRRCEPPGGQVMYKVQAKLESTGKVVINIPLSDGEKLLHHSASAEGSFNMHIIVSWKEQGFYYFQLWSSCKNKQVFTLLENILNACQDIPNNIKREYQSNNFPWPIQPWSLQTPFENFSPDDEDFSGVPETPTKIAGEEMKCSICLEMVVHLLTYTLKECNHTFCFSCIKEWAGTNKNCPICRQPFSLPMLGQEHIGNGRRVNELLELPGDEELPEGALC